MLRIGPEDVLTWFVVLLILTKSIIVTGASTGIGKETVIRLIESGYQVFGLARRYDRLAADQLLPSHLLTSKSGNKSTYVPLEFDITKPESFDEIIDRIVSYINDSEVYGLVNNAGYLEPGAIEDLTMESLRNQFETNFFGHVDFTKRVLKLMKERNRSGCRIVIVSSMAGLISLPLIGAYAASKHALEAVFDALRVELWNTSFKIITINPGVINTCIYENIQHKTKGLLDVQNYNKTRFADAYDKYFLRTNYSGLNPAFVANIIVNIIGSPRPRQRYFIGSKKEMISIRLLPFIPKKILLPLLAKRIHSKS